MRDEAANRPKMPMGGVGFRWATQKGKWDLKLEEGLDGSEIRPVLTFLDSNHEITTVEFDDFSEARLLRRGVSARRVNTADGRSVLVATVNDLPMAQYGVPRGLPGDYPEDYHTGRPYTSAWAEKYADMGREMLLRFARQWGRTAELTRGKCLVIIGAGINHWYHANLMHRAAIHALRFCGRAGVNGSGLAHYVGQEKLAPMESWSAIAYARVWNPAVRLQNAPSWHDVHTDQRRYERNFTDYHTVPQSSNGLARGHTMEMQVRAGRCGWLPFYPQFNKNSLEIVKEAEQASASTPEAVNAHVVRQLLEGKLRLAVEDPDAPENWPRVWFLWRGHALMASAKGHEFFLKHCLGTHTNAIAEDLSRDAVRGVRWHEQAPQGKLDLVVELNFHMDTSALYSDVVLPAATWYEKADSHPTDLHSFIHPHLGRRAALQGIQGRRADIQGARAQVHRTGRAALQRPGARPGGRAAGPRHAGGNRPAGNP